MSQSLDAVSEERLEVSKSLGSLDAVSEEGLEAAKSSEVSKGLRRFRGEELSVSEAAGTAARHPPWRVRNGSRCFSVASGGHIAIIAQWQSTDPKAHSALPPSRLRQLLHVMGKRA